MINLSPIKIGPTLGPVFVQNQKASREIYCHELSETISLADRIFQDTNLKDGSNKDFKYPMLLSVTVIPEYKSIIGAYEPMIQEHIERRILCFLQQLVVCYQTRLYFESRGAQDQGPSAHPIQVVFNDEPVEISKRQAAHSSTLPCLIAYDKEEWDAYLSGERNKPQGFVFLKGSDYYRTANATMNMPKWVNDADREIDEKTSASLLRKNALAIINRAAQGQVTPEEGIAKFLNACIKEVQNARKRLSSKKTNSEVQEVLALYEDLFRDFQAGINNDSNFLEQFLNIRIDSKMQDDTTKGQILKIRYAAIRNSQIAQSDLIQKIDKVKKQVLKILGKKPTYFDAAFRTVLIEQPTVQRDRQRLEKLYNFSPEAFSSQLTHHSKGENTKFNKTKNKLLASHILTHIQWVAKEILQDMRHLLTQEQHERARLIKTFRFLKGWTQKELGIEVKNRFSHAAASQSTISRIETGQKLVEPRIANEFSEVFKVDAGLFMPQFFYA